MAVKTKKNPAYDKLRQDLKNGTPKPLYAFFGEERYLLMHYLREIRALVSEGTEEFNYRRFEGKSMSLNDLSDAIDALPVFAERTVTEVWDYDFERGGEDSRKALFELLSDIPDYACVVFVFESAEFKLDGRVKLNASIKKLFEQVSFSVQERDELTKWISRHFREYGKRIDKENAEHLVFVTGGLMTTLSGEIEKLSAYASGDVVTRSDIDAVVTPVLDAAVYELTDAVLKGDNDLAVSKLYELLAMNEAPHRILFSIATKMRQLLAAKLLVQEGKGASELMTLCGIRYDFQARAVISAARMLSSDECVRLTALTSKAAYALNTSSRDERGVLTEMLLRMASIRKAVR